MFTLYIRANVMRVTLLSIVYDWLIITSIQEEFIWNVLFDYIIIVKMISIVDIFNESSTN